MLRVHTEGTCSSVTATTLPLRGIDSRMLLAPECLLQKFRNIIVERMHRAGWLVNILTNKMELLSERFASTGATVFATGVYTSMSATVEHSTCISCPKLLAVGSVTVETRDIVSFKGATSRGDFAVVLYVTHGKHYLRTSKGRYHLNWRREIKARLLISFF